MGGIDTSRRRNALRPYPRPDWKRLNVMRDHDHKTTVLLVGAGIMNLMTAKFLAARGYQVHFVDAGPNPQSCKD